MSVCPGKIITREIVLEILRCAQNDNYIKDDVYII